MTQTKVAYSLETFMGQTTILKIEILFKLFLTSYKMALQCTYST